MIFDNSKNPSTLIAEGLKINEISVYDSELYTQFLNYDKKR